MKMPEYLIGIMYHEPDSFEQWNRGIIEDYESSTGLYIEADSEQAAIEWGEHVGEALLRLANANQTLDWKSFGHRCWLESSPNTSCWAHCLDFFQHVRFGQMPDLKRMTTASYTKWLKDG
jgi:hypothetical protein